MGREIIENLEEQEEAPVQEEATDVAEETTEAGDEQLNVIDSMVAEGNETSFAVRKNGNMGTFAYDFGVDLDSMVERFGADLVFTMAKAQLIVKAQAVVRPLTAKGMSAVEVIKTWEPGVKRTAIPVDKKAVADQYVEDTPIEELEALLAKIQAKMGNN